MPAFVFPEPTDQSIRAHLAQHHGVPQSARSPEWLLDYHQRSHVARRSDHNHEQPYTVTVVLSASEYHTLHTSGKRFTPSVRRIITARLLDALPPPPECGDPLSIGFDIRCKRTDSHSQHRTNYGGRYVYWGPADDEQEED